MYTGSIIRLPDLPGFPVVVLPWYAEIATLYLAFSIVEGTLLGEFIISDFRLYEPGNNNNLSNGHSIGLHINSGNKLLPFRVSLTIHEYLFIPKMFKENSIFLFTYNEKVPSELLTAENDIVNKYL